MIQEWLSLIKREFSGYTRKKFQKDLLAGLTVAAVALPLALAFGVASGADAAAGLVTAVLAGVIIGILSGAPYQISGPTGAMSAVLIILSTRYGLQGIWLAGLMAGAMILVLGLLRLGRIVSLIPAPVISGFTSGIAVIIAFGQIDNLLGIKSPAAENIIEKLAYYLETPLQPNLYAVSLTVFVVATMIVWPRLPVSGQVPGSLVGIILATLIASTAGLDVPVIGAIPRTILLDQRLRLAEIPWSDAGALFVPAMSIAALGAIESLLCGAVAGNMTGVRMHNSVELVAQGIGNLLIPFFGGVPATAAIARTSVNVKSGAFTRLSSVIHGIALLAAGVAFAPIIGRVPLAALAGVLFVTAWRMNEWHAIHFFFSSRLKHAMIAFGITLAATVLLDLTQAILVGFGISSLIFMAQMSELDITRQLVDPERLAAGGHEFVHPDHPISVYYVSGPLFFAAAYRLLEKITAEDTPGTTLILSIRGVPLVDATGVHVLKEILSRQVQGGGNLLLASVQPRVEQLLKRTGVWDQVTPERIFWSADRAILSLGASLPAEPVEAAPPVNLTPTLIITPHEDRADQKF